MAGGAESYHRSYRGPERRGRLVGVGLALSTLLFAAPQVRAVRTETWTHQQEADYRNGKFDKTLVTSRGQLRLSKAVKEILKDRSDVEYVNCIVQGADGRIYAGTGPAGIVFKIEAGRASPYFNASAANVCSLLVGRGNLLYAGTGGKTGQIYQITAKDQGVVIFKEKDVHYVWAMVEGPKGQIYAATGPNGQLFEVIPGGQTRQIYKAKKEKNLLSLAIDPRGILYAGSDTNGLIYRLDPKKAKAEVLYDANEAEISVILLDRQGDVFAATADTSQARPQASAVRRPPAGRPAPKAGLPAGGAKPGASPRTKPASRPAGRPLPTRPSLVRRPPGRPTGSPTPAAKGGNAVYQIDPTGYVTEVFRQPVMILSMAWDGDRLLIGTGNEGRIHQVDIDNEVDARIAKLAPKQVLALLVTKAGAVLAGTANAGRIYELSKGFAKQGTFISPELDAKQLSRWGRLRWRGSVPGKTAVSFATRTGNVKDADDDTWSDWSAEVVPGPNQSFQIPSPSNRRYLQYRVTLKSLDGTNTPQVDRIAVNYVMANAPPKVTAFSVAAQMGPRRSGPPRPPGGPRGRLGKPLIAGLPPQDRRTLNWQAADPNADPLEYELFYRLKSGGQWILLKDKLKLNKFIWDTKTVADGWYELKVRASDGPGNSKELARSDERISDPVLVDNTPPEVANLKSAVRQGVLRVTMTVRDRYSAIKHLSFAVDSAKDFSVVFPVDDVFDDTVEQFDFAVRDAKPGPHQLSLRAADAQGNVRFYNLIFKIPK